MAAVRMGEKNELSEFGRALAAARRIVEGTCEMCGKPIKGTRRRRYCGHTCAQRAYDARKRAERAAEAARQQGGRG